MHKSKSAEKCNKIARHEEQLHIYKTAVVP